MFAGERQWSRLWGCHSGRGPALLERARSSEGPDSKQTERWAVKCQLVLREKSNAGRGHEKGAT